MTITVELPPEVESKIKMQATNDGLKVEDYVQLLIKEASDRRERIEKNSEKSFDEIFAPVRQGFEAREMDEDKILEFFEEVREEVWQEKQNPQ